MTGDVLFNAIAWRVDGVARNYGFGALSVADTQVVDLDALNYSRLEVAMCETVPFQLVVVTPFVLTTDHPGADDQSVPWWGDTRGVHTTRAGCGLRRRETRFVGGDAAYALETIDHGQVVAYAGADPMGTARNGILRVGSHSRFGFGELRVRSAIDDRVPDRAATDGDAT